MSPVPLMSSSRSSGHRHQRRHLDHQQFVAKLGKRIAIVEDFPAFIVNRVLLPIINEAIYTLL